LTFSGSYSQLLDYVIFANLLFYVLTVTGLFVLRRKQPNAERPYRAFAYPALPAIYVILCAVIMLDLLVVKPLYTWPGLIIVLTGIPVYFLWQRKAHIDSPKPDPATL
jgi:APA family basic amino acid/polyamine antiporter